MTKLSVIATGFFLFLPLLSPLTSALMGQELTQELTQESKNPSLETYLGAEFIAGQALELVYKFKTGDDLLSRLDWQIPPAIGLSFGLRARWLDNLQTSLTFSTLWPLIRGNMVDDDWLSGPSSQEPDIHSDTGITLKFYNHLRFETSFPFAIEKLVIEPGLGLDYRSLAWDGFETVQVGLAAGTYYGQTFAYDQQWLVPWLSLKVGLALKEFDINLGLRLSPWLYGQGRDIHVLRLLTFLDYVYGGYMISPSLNMTLRISKSLSIASLLEYELIAGTRGDTLTSSNGETNLNAAYGRSYSQAGMGYQATRLLFFLKVGP